ncbi:hypothetical protein Tco_0226075 [Tanacetum coccineum]
MLCGVIIRHKKPTSGNEQALKNILDKMMDQEKEATEQSDAVRKEFEAQCNMELRQGKATRASSSNNFNTVSTPVNTAGLIMNFCTYDDDDLDTCNSPYVDQVVGLQGSDFILHGPFTHVDKVYNVEKALYELHQAPRAWYETLSTYLLANAMLQRLNLLSSSGQLTFFLGLQVKQKEDGIFISQDKYVGEILKKFGFFSIRTANTPMETNKALTKDKDGEGLSVHFYRYLKGRPKLGLWYPKDSPFILEAFLDSDYAGASLDRKSTTGGFQFHGSRLISWQCKNQSAMANSTTKAEYIAASHYCGQVLWIQNQLLDHGYNFMQTKIHVDNESAICVVKNHVYHSKSKHIEIRHHFIRDSYEKRLIEMVKIHTDNNVADLLTKAFDMNLKLNLISQGLVLLDEVVLKEGVKFLWKGLSLLLLGWQSQAPRHHGGAPAQTRSERVLEKPIKPPLSEGGNTAISDEGRMELIKELMETCTLLTKRVLALEEAKNAQDRDASKQGRSSDKAKPMPEVSVATPSSPPTTTTVFDDEDVTMAMAQTLIKMKEVKAKEKGVEFRNVEESTRPVRSITTLQHLPKIDLKYKELAQIFHEEELAELDRAQIERQRQEEATNAALTEEFDEIQARIDVDALFAAKLQQE